MVKIFIDVREGARGRRFKEILEAAGHEVYIKQLAIGDYRIGNSVCIEYKTPADFAASVVDQRLFKQSHFMQEEYYTSFVVVDGSMSDCVAESELTMSAIIGATTSVMYREGVPVVFLSGAGFIDFVLSVIKKIEKQSSVIYRPVAKKSVVPDDQIRFLSGLPKIGLKMARKLLEKYHTPFNALKELDDWKDVRVGPEAKENIRRILHEKYDSYRET